MKCPKCHFDNPDDTLYCSMCAAPFPASKEDTSYMEVPSSLKSEGFWKEVSKFQLIYSLAGLVLGLVCIIRGYCTFSSWNNWSYKLGC